jgi:hypothetical protein
VGEQAITMNERAILVVVLGFAALLIVIADDWWKRRLVRRAEEKGKKARADLYVNKPRWSIVIAIAVGLITYAYLLTRPDLTNRDFGPLTPLVRWFFSNTR